MPKVSIIVPIYNVEKYLDHCMQSLLNQTLKDIEIIMVDDGSPDNCPQMCDEYAKIDNRIKVIHKKNGGLSDARNAGLNIATGEYVAFIDSDDYTSTEAYEILYNKAKETNADIVFAGFKYQNADGSIDKCFLLDNIFDNHDAIIEFLSSMIYDKKPRKDTIWMSVWNGIYKRELLEKNRISFKSEREYLSEDILFHTQLIPLCKRIVCIPKTFYNYCYNDMSLTRKFNTKKIDSNFRLYEALTNTAKKYNISNIQWKISLFLIGYTRGIILRGIIMSDMTFTEKRKYCMKVYNYSRWPDVIKSLNNINIPLFDKIGLMFIRYKAFILNVFIYYIYYSFFKKD